MVSPTMSVGRWGSWSVPLSVQEMGFMVCPIKCAGDGAHGLCHYVCRRWGSWSVPLCVQEMGSWSVPLCVQEIGELREQLRDVMFYLEAQDKLATTADVSQEEIQDGQVIVGAAAAPETGGKKRSKKRR